MSTAGAPGGNHVPRGITARARDLVVVKHRTYVDSRGALVPIELVKVVPYAVARLFWIGDVPSGQQRGAHAHYSCSQYMICMAGVVRIDATDGIEQRTFDLAVGEALLVPPLIWATEQYIGDGAMLLVLCDKPYDADDYIHSFEKFRAAVANRA